MASLRARFMGRTWGPSGADRSVNLIFNFSLMSVQAFAPYKISAWFPYSLHELTSYVYFLHPPKYMQTEWEHQVDFVSKNGHYFCMHRLDDKRTQWPTLFRQWFCNIEANRHESCTRLRQRVKIKVARISSESVKFHLTKLAMMFKLNFEKKYVRSLRTSVHNWLLTKVNISFIGNDH